MSHFINERGTIVTESLDAAIMDAGEGKLARLDGYPDIKVVVRKDWDKSKVAVVSGGGSGHEPAHAGFVGKGMLTAAVCGEIFASPSVDAVLAAILAVTGKAGCLLVVKNYTGDRLNFGLAAEKAKALGLAVEMVIVGDDVAIEGAAQPRGIAGTLFVHKVAGALAEASASLAEVKHAAERVAHSVVSLGLSLSSVEVPGQPISAAERAKPRIAEGEAELGLGIHGEPGREKIALAPANVLVAKVVERLEHALAHPRVGAPSSGELAVLVNNLGGVSPLEMGVITHAVLTSTIAKRIGLIFGPAPLMTSLDMKGFSLSLLPLDGSLRAALEARVDIPAWPAAHVPGPISLVPMPAAIHRVHFAPSSDPARRADLAKICDRLVAIEGELNGLDAKVGDGDTGTTVATAARAILADLDRLPLANQSELCIALADRLSKVMGGSSGILLAIFAAAMGTAYGAGETTTVALRRGAERLQAYGGAKAGDRTMLDALLPAIEALEAGGSMADAAKAAKAGAEKTASMKSARAGRSSYVTGDHLSGVPDPGAVAVAQAFDAIAH